MHQFKGRRGWWFGFWQGGARGGSPPRYCMEYLRRRAGSGAVLSGFCRRLIVTDAALAVFEPEAVAVELEDVNVVGKAIEQRAGQALGGEHAGPLVEGQVAGDGNRAAWVKPDRQCKILKVNYETANVTVRLPNGAAVEVGLQDLDELAYCNYCRMSYQIELITENGRRFCPICERSEEELVKLLEAREVKELACSPMPVRS
jgi:hypothetical protein